MKVFIIERKFRDGLGNNGKVYKPSQEYLHQKATGMMATKYGPIYTYGVSTNPSVEVWYCTAESVEEVKQHPIIKKWMQECKDSRERFLTQESTNVNAFDCWERIDIKEIPFEVNSTQRHFGLLMVTDSMTQGLSHF